MCATSPRRGPRLFRPYRAELCIRPELPARCPGLICSAILGRQTHSRTCRFEITGFSIPTEVRLMTHRIYRGVRHGRARALVVETLEDRTLPSTCVVNNLGDTGGGRRSFGD